MKKNVTIEGMRTRVLSFLFQAVFLCAIPLMVNGQDCLTIDCNAAGPQNQLANPSFETNNGHDAIGVQDWQVFFDAWGSVRVFDDNTNPAADAQEGNFFIKMFGPNSGLFQDFSVSPGDNITGSVYMQNLSFDATLPNGTGQVKLEWLGVGGVVVGVETSPLFTAAFPQNVWTEISVNAVAPAVATGVRFVLISNQPSGGAIMFDSASLLNSSIAGSGLVGDVSVSNDSGACGAELALATPATGGDCNVVSITNDYTGTDNASGFYPIGTTTVTWTATGTEPLPDIALLSATGGVANAEADIVAKLSATGAFNSISTINVAVTTPSLATLQQYDAVLVWNDDPFQNEFALGDVLAAYVDAGGGVVVSMFTQWSPSNFDLQGNFRNNGYLPLDGTASPFAAAGPHIMSIVDGSHPIMQGVSSFNGGTASFRGTNLSLQPGASLLANWSTGDPLIAYKEPTNGRTVSLNFYPPSSDIRGDLWNASTDGDLIMANSLAWAAGYEGTVSTATCSVDITVTDDEAPTLDCVATGINSGNVLNAAGFEDAAGNNTQYNSASWTREGVSPPFALNLGTLQEGDFYVKLFGANTSLSQEHPVAAGDEVQASVFIKSASFDPIQPGCEALIKLEYSNGVVVESVPVLGPIPIETWTQITLNDVAPAGATSVQYVAFMNCSGGGAVMFDDASMNIISPIDGSVGDVTVDNDLGECGAQLNLAVPVSGDNCPGAVLINDFNGTGDASDFYPVGTTTVNWTVTDAAGNSATCSVDITVNDMENPTITCPSNDTVDANADCEAVLGDYTGSVVASDNCDEDLEVSQSPEAGSTLSLGENAITITVTDDAGNSDECEFNVTVLDNPTVSISSPQDGIDDEVDGIVTIYFGPSSVLEALGVTNFADLISTLDADCTDGVSYQWQYQNLGDGTAPIAGEWVDTLGTSEDIVVNASGDHDFHHAYRVVITNSIDETSTSNYIRVYSIDTRCKGPNKVKVCMVPNGNPDNAHEICININAVDAILENSPGSFVGPCDPDFKINNPEDLEPQITVYPNPTNSQLFINYVSYVDNNTVIELYNSRGKMIKEVFNGRAIADQKLGLNFDMQAFSNGIYLLRVIDSSGVHSKKVILTK